MKWMEYRLGYGLDHGSIDVQFPGRERDASRFTV
jgi:hypothetical protein